MTLYLLLTSKYIYLHFQENQCIYKPLSLFSCLGQGNAITLWLLSHGPRLVIPPLAETWSRVSIAPSLNRGIPLQRRALISDTPSYGCGTDDISRALCVPVIHTWVGWHVDWGWIWECRHHSSKWSWGSGGGVSGTLRHRVECGC